MNTLAHFLFPAPAKRSPGAIFRWWEARRLGYNAIMAGTGLFSLGASTLVAHMPPGSTEMPPLIAILGYAVIANMFYVLGPITECLLELVWPNQVLPTGPALFRMGLTFSVGLNFIPCLIMAWDWVIRVLNWLL